MIEAETFGKIRPCIIRSIKPEKKILASDINVLCVKWGDKFNADYVNRLHAMVTRNLTVPFRFYCLTEDPRGLHEGIHVIPLPDLGLEFCWNKLVLFSDVLDGLKGTAIFFDLDIVITDNIDCLINHRPQESFLGIFDWNRKNNPQFNASVMRFTLGHHNHVWESFCEKTANGSLLKAREWDAYLGSNDKVVYWEANVRYGGDQEWTSRQLFPAAEISAHSYPESWILSYKTHGRNHLPGGCKVMVFHGYPKPHEVHNDYVLMHWK